MRLIHKLLLVVIVCCAYSAIVLAADVYYDSGEQVTVPDCWITIQSQPCEEPEECPEPPPLYNCCGDIWVTDPKLCRQADCVIPPAMPPADKLLRQQDFLRGG